MLLILRIVSFLTLQGILDVLANLDALQGAQVDNNVRSVRVNPGLLRGDALAQDHDPNNMLDISDVDSFSAGSDPTASDMDGVDFDVDLSYVGLPAATGFDCTWDEMSSFLTHGPATSHRPTAQYALEFAAAAFPLRPTNFPASGFRSLHSDTLSLQLPLLRQQWAAWRQSHEHLLKQPPLKPLLLPCPSPQISESVSLPALALVEQWLRDGCSQDLDGGVDHKQAAFLVLFATCLQVLPSKPRYFSCQSFLSTFSFTGGFISAQSVFKFTVSLLSCDIWLLACQTFRNAS